MNDSDHAELTLQEYVGVLRGWRIPILLLLAIATSGAAVAAYVLPKKYTATVLISPVTNSGSSGLLSGLNSMVSQIGGLASLAGVSQTSDSTKAESLATLESEELTDAYIEQNNLLPVIFRSKWDSKKGVWIDQDPRHIPTLWQANQYFKKRVRDVTADSKTGLVSLKITWTDPATAAKWANDLVRMTNQYRRDKAIQESERNVSFLTSEAAKTDVVGVKQAIYSILQNEISKMMLARGNEEYALKVIDPRNSTRETFITVASLLDCWGILYDVGPLYDGGLSQGYDRPPDSNPRYIRLSLRRMSRQSVAKAAPGRLHDSL